MVRCDSVLICDAAFNDEGHNLCVLGWQRSLRPPMMPFGLHRLDIVVLLSGEPEERFDLRVRFETPMAESVIDATTNVGIGTTGYLHAVFNMWNPAFAIPGDYRAIVFVNGREAKRVVLPVADAPPAPPPLPDDVVRH